MQPYVSAGVDPLLYRDSGDPERRRAGLGQIAHFTAMANAKTRRVGCTAAGGKRYTYGVIHVCNYSPPGNVVSR